jgi:hypothetical protein
MGLSVNSEVHEHYLKLTVIGQWELREILKFIETVRVACQSAQRNKVLIDVRGVEGERPDEDRLWAGRQTALALSREVKVAVVEQADRINRLAEDAAVSRGARLLVAPTEQEAVAWLASD